MYQKLLICSLLLLSGCWSDITLTWDNPTQDVAGEYLAPEELGDCEVRATAYLLTDPPTPPLSISEFVPCRLQEFTFTNMPPSNIVLYDVRANRIAYDLDGNVVPLLWSDWSEPVSAY